MSQYGYGGRAPYGQQQQSGPGGYGAPPTAQSQGGYGETSSRYGSSHGYNQNNSIDAGYGGGSVEMAPLAQHAGSMAQGDPNAILNECREIDRGVDSIERNLEQLRMLQQRTLDDADASSSSATNRQLDSLSSETMAQYRALTERIRHVKSNPDSRTPKNNPQVGRVDRRLKAAITQYQQVESQFRKRTEEQMARQFRIIRPDATEQEVRRAIEDTSGGQVFQQAMMQSAKTGRARAAFTAVEDRHKALVKIEEQMMELAQLFQDMDTLVVQQEPAVLQIEQKGEEVIDHLGKGNDELGGAVDKARSARKKKWICLGICVAIILIIVIIVVIYFLVIKGDSGGGGGDKNGGDSSNNKRELPISFGSLPVIHPGGAQGFGARLARRTLQDIQDANMGALRQGRIHMPQMPT